MGIGGLMGVQGVGARKWMGNFGRSLLDRAMRSRKRDFDGPPPFCGEVVDSIGRYTRY